MTALLAVKKAGRVDLLSDGAAYNTQGVMVAVIDKVIALPRASAAIALRGPQNPAATLKEAFSDLASFDALIELVPRVLDDARRSWLETSPLAWEALIVGVTDAGESEIHFYSADGQLGAIPCHFYGAGPQPSVRTYYNAGYVPFDDGEEFDAVTHGLPIMEAMRATPERLQGDGVMMHGVGAFVAHTVIERRSVKTEIIHIWSDKLDEKINPSRKGRSVAEWTRLLQLNPPNLHTEKALNP